MTRKLLRILCLLYVPCASFALSSDATQQIKITSNSVEYNQHLNTITYIGNVVANQGTTKVTAETAIVTLNKTNHIDHLTAQGKPATYSTILKEQQPPILASGETIKYFPATGRLELIKKGHITQNGNTFDAPYIVYDMQKQTLISKPSSHERTTIVLQPQHSVK